MTKGQGSKMDPTQSDNWWKSRIQKEEVAYGDKKKPAAAVTGVSLNSLGTAMEVQHGPLAKETHLIGSGATVKGWKPEAEIPATDIKAGMIASGRLKEGDPETGSQASVARSTASQAKGLRGSQAGSKASSSMEIMNRLARLEQELQAERLRRQAAESEMKDLLLASKAG